MVKFSIISSSQVGIIFTIFRKGYNNFKDKKEYGE